MSIEDVMLENFAMTLSTRNQISWTQAEEHVEVYWSRRQFLSLTICQNWRHDWRKRWGWVYCWVKHQRQVFIRLQIWHFRKALPIWLQFSVVKVILTFSYNTMNPKCQLWLNTAASHRFRPLWHSMYASSGGERWETAVFASLLLLVRECLPIQEFSGCPKKLSAQRVQSLD